MARSKLTVCSPRPRLKRNLSRALVHNLALAEDGKIAALVHGNNVLVLNCASSLTRPCAESSSADDSLTGAWRFSGVIKNGFLRRWAM